MGGIWRWWERLNELFFLLKQGKGRREGKGKGGGGGGGGGV